MPPKTATSSINKHANVKAKKVPTQTTSAKTGSSVVAASLSTNNRSNQLHSAAAAPLINRQDGQLLLDEIRLFAKETALSRSGTLFALHYQVLMDILDEATFACQHGTTSDKQTNDSDDVDGELPSSLPHHMDNDMKRQLCDITWTQVQQVAIAFESQPHFERFTDIIITIVRDRLRQRWERMSLLDKYSILKAEEISAAERAKRLGVATLPDQPHFRAPNTLAALPTGTSVASATTPAARHRPKEVKGDRDQEKRLDRERRARTGIVGPRGVTEDALVYGEVDFNGIAVIIMDQIISLIPPNSVFYDIGSGTGRGVFAAWLLYPFKICRGVELLTSLHDIAVESLNTEMARCQPASVAASGRSKAGKKASNTNTNGSNGSKGMAKGAANKSTGHAAHCPLAYTSATMSTTPSTEYKQSTTITSTSAMETNSLSTSSASSSPSSASASTASTSTSVASLATFHNRCCCSMSYHFNSMSLVNADIRKYDWSDGDVVFAHSTCFDASLMTYLTNEAAKLKKGSLFICTSEPLSSPHFEHVKKFVCRMAWGRPTVHVHRRL